ncbi:MAG: hypothetical protein DRG78_21180, partial [Epsilonproteobacteria bacterium]
GGLGIDISDLISITGKDTLIITDTADNGERVNINTDEFVNHSNDGSGHEIYTDATGEYTILIDDTIFVD